MKKHRAFRKTKSTDLSLIFDSRICEIHDVHRFWGSKITEFRSFCIKKFESHFLGTLLRIYVAFLFNFLNRFQSLRCEHQIWQFEYRCMRTSILKYSRYWLVPITADYFRRKYVRGGGGGSRAQGERNLSRGLEVDDRACFQFCSVVWLRCTRSKVYIYVSEYRGTGVREREELRERTFREILSAAAASFRSLRSSI